MKKAKPAEDEPITLKALEKSLIKLMGPDSVSMDEEFRVKRDVEFMGTGIPELDKVLGGGIPRSRIVEFFGTEGGGKTSLALQTAAAVQKAGGQVAFFDYEYALSDEWAERQGVDIKKMWVFRPHYGEEFFMAVKDMAKYNKVDLVIVDSVAAMLPKSMELVDEMKSFMGSQARMFSQGLMSIQSAVGNSRMAIILINQIRMKIGVMFGNPEDTPGGRALKFYYSIRLRVSKMNKATQHGNEMRHEVKVKTVKNKVAMPFQEADFTISYPILGLDGDEPEVDDSADDITIAIRKKLVRAGKAGGWYTVVEDGAMLHGVRHFKKYCEEHPEFVEKLRG